MIRLGLDLDQRLAARPVRAEALRAELGVPPERFLVAWLGRMTEIKQVDDLLRAFARLRATESTPTCCSSATGRSGRASRRSPATLGIRDRCHFSGFRTDVGTIYAASDVVVLTSANEGTPVTVIEAQAAGKPVVSTDVGGVRDIVTDGVSGFVVPPGDMDALADRLKALAADPDLRARFGRCRPRRARPVLGAAARARRRPPLPRAARADEPRHARPRSRCTRLLPATPGDRSARPPPDHPRLAVLPARDRRDAVADAGVRRVPRRTRARRHRRRGVPEPSAGRHPARVPRPHRRGRPLEPVSRAPGVGAHEPREDADDAALLLPLVHGARRCGRAVHRPVRRRRRDDAAALHRPARAGRLRG